MLLAQQVNRPLFEFTLEPLREDHGVALAVMGILVVFVALVLVVVFITLLPRVADLLHRVLAQSAPSAASEPSAATASEEAAPASAAEEDALPEEIVVVIAAAVAEAIRRPHRIVQIRGLTPAEMGWSLEGRLLHHHSHRIRGRQ